MQREDGWGRDFGHPRGPASGAQPSLRSPPPEAQFLQEQSQPPLPLGQRPPAPLPPLPSTKYNLPPAAYGGFSPHEMLPEGQDEQDVQRQPQREHQQTFQYQPPQQSQLAADQQQPPPAQSQEFSPPGDERAEPLPTDLAAQQQISADDHLGHDPQQQSGLLYQDQPPPTEDQQQQLVQSPQQLHEQPPLGSYGIPPQATHPDIGMQPSADDYGQYNFRQLQGQQRQQHFLQGRYHQPAAVPAAYDGYSEGLYGPPPQQYYESPYLGPGYPSDWAEGEPHYNYDPNMVDYQQRQQGVAQQQQPPQGFGYHDPRMANVPGVWRTMSYVSTSSSLPSQPGQQPEAQPSAAAHATPASIEEYREHAKRSNDPQVQFEFAKFLLEVAATAPDSVPDDPKTSKKHREGLLHEGLKLVKRLASQGIGLGKTAHPEAQFFLANCYGTGSIGLTVDHDKAFALYVQASKQNHPAATYRTAVCYELGAGTKRDQARAVQFYRKAAALGDTAAMYKLGMILLNGLLGQQKNPRDAITWLKRASAVADEENPHALHQLGLCYEKAGIPNLIPDEAYARELFAKAAQLGYAPSQFKMGSCYEYGTLTCPVDPRRSIYWYTRAAEQGDPESELALSGWYLTGAETVLRQSDTEAYLWARKAADKGLAKAEYAVGYYSEVGIGVRQDVDEAKRWYMRAAAQGNKRAMQRLTELKRLGSAGRRAKPEKHTRGQGGDCIIS